MESSSARLRQATDLEQTPLRHRREDWRILAAVATTKDLGDKQVLGDLLDQIQEKITKVIGDGGYDYATCYKKIAK